MARASRHPMFLGGLFQEGGGEEGEGVSRLMCLVAEANKLTEFQWV